MTHPINTQEHAGGQYTNIISNDRHKFYADEPVELGGTDIGPTPFEYLCAALGACTSITLRMYANRKGWPLGHISVDVVHEKIKTADGEPRDQFARKVRLKGDLDIDQRERLMEIAEKCPVHRTLERSSNILTTEITE